MDLLLVLDYSIETLKDFEQGIELSIFAQFLQMEDISASARFSISTLTNKVESRRIGSV
jgi:predicted metal-dependent hydrolase